MPEPGDWHISRLEVENFRCFERLDMTFDPRLTVLIGPNGTGKTAVLDALAVMLSTVLQAFEAGSRGFATDDAREVPRDLDFQDAVARMETVYPVRAGVDATLAGWQFEWHRERRSAKGRTSWGDKLVVRDTVAQLLKQERALLPVLALYGVERLIGVRKATGAIARSRIGAYDAALDGKSDLTRLSGFIEALTLADFVADSRGDEARAARNQLTAISLACNRMLGVTGWRDPVWNPIVRGLTLRHSAHGELPLSSLSSGIKIAAGLVIDLVSRMARANPARGAEDLLESVPGIVLIDEIDLHLHPTWQQQILPALTATFPRVQFIVTTHSPQVLSTVEGHRIRVLGETDAREVPFAAGLRSDIVLAEVMDTSPAPRLDINKELDRYLDLVDQGAGRSAEAVRLRLKLDEELGGIANVPQLADADAKIAFFDMDE
ncbi:AAA family ATPase [Nocardia harenae]|uniref:AAA family ATPase n=1 Tax=Nocardia harenae TaxID=358707 RepID=UPI000AE690AE|nr:AAA family ATPase [Nocardia harenae]